MALDRAEPIHEPLVIDGAYDYTSADLEDWQGEATFRRVYPGMVERVRAAGLDPARKPRPLDVAPARRELGYVPRYSLANLLAELERFGVEGPPPPWKMTASDSLWPVAVDSYYESRKN